MKKDKKSKGTALGRRQAATWSWSVEDDQRDEETLEAVGEETGADISLQQQAVVVPSEVLEAPVIPVEDRTPGRTGSKQKLCKLVKEETFADDMTRYMELIREPHYVCRKCGRSAGDRGNLCRPVPMEFKYE